MSVNVLGIWRHSRKPPWILSLEAKGKNMTGFLMHDISKYPVQAFLTGGRRFTLLWSDPQYRNYRGVASMELPSDGESLIGIRPESSDAQMMAGNPFGRGSTWNCVKHGTAPSPPQPPAPPKKPPPRRHPPRERPQSDLKLLWDMKAKLSWRIDTGDKKWLARYKALFRKVHGRDPTKEELEY